MIGGCLGPRWRVWESWGADPWVVEVLRFGFQVSFLVTLLFPMCRFPFPATPRLPSGLALSAAVADLRAKGAIEPLALSPGYYSCLCYPQVHRGLGACDKPIPSQPVCLSLPFSHGDSAIGPPVSASWRLGGVSGPEGRVPSGSCASGVSLLSEIQCRGGGLTISRALLRPFDCSTGVHLHHGPDFVDYASSRVPDPEVPRRLASPRVLVPGSGSGEGLFLWLCQELGVRVNLEKSSLTPTQTLDYLGFS